MRIAATYDDGNVAESFGQATQFKLYLVDEGEIFNSMVIDADGISYTARVQSLKARKVDTLICGSLNDEARAVLDEAGITCHTGVTGSADDAAQALVENRL